MELKEFLSETLLSIIAGVTDAQKKAAEHGALINPTGLMRNITNVSDNAIWDNRNNNYAQSISFDVAITAEDSATGGAKVKVLTGILGGNIGGEKGSKNSVASRIQFVVPILLPSQSIDDPAAAAPRPMKINPEVINKMAR